MGSECVVGKIIPGREIEKSHQSQILFWGLKGWSVTPKIFDDGPVLMHNDYWTVKQFKSIESAVKIFTCFPHIYRK